MYSCICGCVCVCVSVNKCNSCRLSREMIWFFFWGENVKKQTFAWETQLKREFSTFCFVVHFHFHSFHLSHAGNATIITKQQKLTDTNNKTEIKKKTKHQQNCTFRCKHKLLITVSRNFNLYNCCNKFKKKVSARDMISNNNDIRTYGIVGEFQNGRKINYCNYFDACQIFVLFLSMFLFEVH